MVADRLAQEPDAASADHAWGRTGGVREAGVDLSEAGAVAQHLLGMFREIRKSY